MEVDSEKGFVGFAKYSKLVEDNPKKDNETTMDKEKAEKLVVSWFENNNPQSTKDSRGKIGFKPFIGLSCIFLMIVAGLVSGLIIMAMKIQSLKETVSILDQQNQNLTNSLEFQEQIATGFKIQKQELLIELENIQQNLSDFHLLNEAEIERLNLENLMLQTEKDFLHKNLNTNLTKFHKAIEDGDLEKVKLWIKFGADIKSVIIESQDMTPFFFAAARGYKEIAKLLLQNGANVNARVKLHQFTVLHAACMKGHIEIVKLLLQNGADINAKDNDKWTPLHWVAKNGNLEIAKLILQYGADLNVKDQYQDTPLLLAVLKGNNEMVELLIQNGADVDVRNEDGNTPLHYAAASGHFRIVENLVKHGAKRDLKDNQGRTPLEDAEYYKRGDYQQIVELLKNN